nr:MAG TPA: hypothetical protein [Caudoviricetes sp.]
MCQNPRDRALTTKWFGLFFSKISNKEVSSV